MGQANLSKDSVAGAVHSNGDPIRARSLILAFGFPMPACGRHRTPHFRPCDPDVAGEERRDSPTTTTDPRMNNLVSFPLVAGQVRHFDLCAYTTAAGTLGPDRNGKTRRCIRR